jgi:hypothetical protein
MSLAAVSGVVRRLQFQQMKLASTNLDNIQAYFFVGLGLNSSM